MAPKRKAAKRKAAKRRERSDVWVWVVAAAVTIGASIGILGFLLPRLTAETISRPEAAALYERHCGTCHGLEGQGNLGPQLGDHAVVEAYPDIDDQIAVMTDGRGDMPPFGHALSGAEIRAVADYTRRL